MCKIDQLQDSLREIIMTINCKFPNIRAVSLAFPSSMKTVELILWYCCRLCLLPEVKLPNLLLPPLNGHINECLSDKDVVIVSMH